MVTFKWATVTQTSPLRIRVDGDTSELPFEPDSLVEPQQLQVGDRVRCEWSGNRLVILGVAGGGRTMRLSFADTTALNAFEGWPGLVGFVESDNSEYVWRSGWNLWNMPWKVWPMILTNVTLGNGSTSGRKAIVNGTVFAEGRIEFGSTTEVTGIFHVSAPETVANSGMIRGDALAFDASATQWYYGAWIPDAYFIYDNARASASAPFGWGSGDSIRLGLRFELG